MGGSLKRATVENRLFCPPHFADTLVPRTGLLTRLAQADQPVALLLGPPGSGKTATLTLFYQNLVAQGKSVLWANLGDGDFDAVTHQAQLSLSDAADEGLYLLLDGLERVSEPEMCRQMERWIVGLPRTIRVLATAHHLHGPVLHDLWLRGQLERIGPEALALDDFEAAALLGPRWSSADACLLNDLMEGWAAGLKFLAQDPTATMALLDPRADSLALPRGLGDYFDDVICAQLSPEILSLLLDLSAFDRFSPDIVASLSTTKAWPEIEELIRRGLFIQYRDATCGWAGLHPAFARHLQRKMRQADPARFESMRIFAANWFAERGFASDAVRHAIGVADSTTAAQIIERAGAISVDLADGPDLGLEVKIPPDRAGELPMLFLSQVYNRLRHGKHHEARIAFDAAAELTENYNRIENSADAEIVATWAASIEIVFYSLADAPVPGDRIAYLETRLLRFLDTQPILAAVIASVLAFFYVDTGRFSEAIRISRLGFHAQRADNSSKVTLFLDLHYASALIATDTIDQAIAHVVHAQKLAHLECGPHTYEVLTSQLMRGVLHYECNELDAALDNLMPALEQLRNINGWLWLYLEGFTAAVSVHCAQGNTEKALQQIRVGEAFAQERNLKRLLRKLAIARVHVLISMGELRDAAQQIDTLLSELAADKCGCRVIESEALLASALLMLELGRPRDALGEIERIDMVLLGDADLRLRFSYHCLFMRAARTLRRYNSAVEHMSVAVGIARQAGLARRAADHSKTLIDVTDLSLRSGRKLPAAVEAYVHSLRSSEPHPASASKTEVVGQNYALSPRESEIITLVAEGLSAKEIASQLGISEGTVKSHRKKIHDKLGVSTRSQAISRARELLII
ncbi:hypothetical protein JHL21_01610 [Devosia sp. WQ 349]|uniref:LuxR C-terminal-related transcriptional regulator n=1 Tax=Devosia sp. WQ 349K1 TaxID=2800329 RepID=UPI00190506FB|nr:LuxR C-terminal-related transcriptional regulator [Devosia sp. WQ 349K1]MBK1793193.1 hypothetical protein [Devosia sp. WQ 349K1]